MAASNSAGSDEDSELNKMVCKLLSVKNTLELDKFTRDTRANDIKEQIKESEKNIKEEIKQCLEEIESTYILHKTKVEPYKNLRLVADKENNEIVCSDDNYKGKTVFKTSLPPEVLGTGSEISEISVEGNGNVTAGTLQEKNIVGNLSNFLLINIRRHNKNTQHLQYINNKLSEYRPIFMAITETHYKNTDSPTFEDYKCYRKDREENQSKKGSGGVCLLLRKDLSKGAKIIYKSKQTCDVIAVHTGAQGQDADPGGHNTDPGGQDSGHGGHNTDQGGQDAGPGGHSSHPLANAIIAVVYRTNRGCNVGKQRCELGDVIKGILNASTELATTRVIICGDFNDKTYEETTHNRESINCNCPIHCKQTFISKKKSDSVIIRQIVPNWFEGFEQFIKCPTNNFGNILDLVFCDDKGLVRTYKCEESVSDHHLVTCITFTEAPSQSESRGSGESGSGPSGSRGAGSEPSGSGESGSKLSGSRGAGSGPSGSDAARSESSVSDVAKKVLQKTVTRA